MSTSPYFLINPVSNDNESLGPSRREINIKSIVIIVVMTIPYILIIVLFALYADVEKDKKVKYVSSFSISAGTLMPSSTFDRITVLSLGSDGLLQVGAGTSVYKHVLDIQQNCTKYLNLAALSNTTFFSSYVNAASKKTTFTTFNIQNSPRKAVDMQTFLSDYSFYEIVVLSQEYGTFVGITQDTSSTEETATVVVGQYMETTGSFSFGTAVLYSSIYSINPKISKLSGNSFAISYYNNDSSALATRIGSVDQSSLAINLSDEVLYAINTNYTLYHALVGLTESSYFLLFYDSSEGSIPNTGSLQAKLAKVKYALDSSSKPTVSIGSTFAFESVSMKDYFAAIAVNNNTAIVAFIDANTGYGVSCVSIGNIPGINDTIILGSYWQVTTGSSVQIENGYSNPDLDIEILTSTGYFNVLFSDVRYYGEMTTVIGYFDGANVVRASPNYRLGQANPDMMKYYAWGALASSSTDTGKARIVIANVFANDNECNNSTMMMISVLEQYPKPFGISISSAGEVAVGGVVSGLNSLVPGKGYYADTTGALVLPSTMDCFVAESDAQTMIFIEDSTTKTLVSPSSLVGTAVTADSMLLQLTT